MAKRLGYRIDLEDRKALKAMCSPMPFTLKDFDGPDEVDHRSWQPVYNQGNMGSCRGWTRRINAELSYYYATRGKRINFSALWCYLMTQKRDGLLGADQGSTIGNGAKMALEDGHALEETCPYPNPVRYTTNIPQAAFPEAEHYKEKSLTDIRSYEDALAFLGGLCGGIDLGAGWPLPIMNGELRSLTSIGRSGHAWAICGHLSRKRFQNRPPLIAVNPHGYSFLVYPEAFTQLLGHRYTVSVGLSHMSRPEPQSYDFLTEGIL